VITAGSKHQLKCFERISDRRARYLISCGDLLIRSWLSFVHIVGVKGV